MVMGGEGDEGVRSRCEEWVGGGVEGWRKGRKWRENEGGKKGRIQREKEREL